MRFQATAVLVALCTLGRVLPAGAAAERIGSRGQMVYAPIYSEIPFAEGKRAVPLTATLSVRNTDRQNAITLKKVDYYDSSGRLVRAYLREARSLVPLASAEFILKESDRRGGISAGFIVEWTSEPTVSPPLIETVMIGTRSGQGISFVSPSRVIEER